MKTALDFPIRQLDQARLNQPVGIHEFPESRSRVAVVAFEKLVDAYEAASLPCSFEQALSNPTIARLLEITAEAWSRRQPPFECRLPPVAVAVTVTSPINPPDHSLETKPRRDVKRASAGDMDDEA